MGILSPAERMISPRRRQDRAVESVSLTVTFKTTREQATELGKVVDSVSYKKGVCAVNIDTNNLTEAVRKVKELLEKVRTFP